MSDDADKLAEIRRRIDEIDAAMHGLLMERGQLIDRLITVKKADTGSAFRPQREADMMRRLVERHGGRLPIDTVESIWRVIISTFTYVQSNYRVHLDLTPGEAAMRDTARFHFGFTVPIVPHQGAAAAILALAEARGDLAIVHAGEINDDAWWVDLIAPEAPKVIARLPFVDRDDHPIGLVTYVVAAPVGEARARDRALYAVDVDDRGQEHAEIEAALAEEGFRLVDAFAVDETLRLLVETPGDLAEPVVGRILIGLLGEGTETAFVGSHAAPYRIG